MSMVRDDPATLAAVGVLAATLASVAHETVGHGGACRAGGGQVTLLTSILFHCRGATLVTDIAGPLAGIAFGGAALAGARHVRLGETSRLALLTVAAIALLWGFGQMARDALMGADDWRQAAAVPGWRWPLVALGVGGYVLAARLMRPVAAALAGEDPAASRRRLLTPLIAGAASATLAGALFAPAPGRSIREALLAVGLAPLGYVWIALAAARAGGPGAPIGRSWPWIAAAAAVFGLFLIQARGFGALRGGL